ncbi:superoxide dismutase [Hydrocoleum sp. CS-953]|uniref:superoxide dismutase n=1 Tax=Hydrocoleum sp. CS-953 TaxID=1671698 RepID=UPI000B9B3024|nr:superoxide dismutase [Hydrocoleum sp. CS-953]OZH55711.1 superoxide dismutase [Hydrocoleum sp. CS-953]
MNINRRNLLILLGTTLGVITLDGCQIPPDNSSASVTPSTLPNDTKLAEKSGVFELTPLPYQYDALEPYIDKETMQFHHGKHYAGYIKKLNGAIANYPELKDKSAEDLLRGLNGLPNDIRTAVQNNGGGYVNHKMFWEIMSPNGGGEPQGKIATAIDESFGNFDSFKDKFNASGGSRFGSGWVWLVLGEDGKLKVISTANQDSPFLTGDYPIMGNDVWEHAYYLRYQNRRGDYLKAWWNVVNWPEVNRRYEEGLTVIS